MKIEVITTFLDGAERFENGDQRTVDDERGARFVSLGWASDLSGRVATGTNDGTPSLNINSSTHDSGDSNG